MRRRTFLATAAVTPVALSACAGEFSNAPTTIDRARLRRDGESLDLALESLRAAPLAASLGITDSRAESLDPPLRDTLSVHVLLDWFRELPRDERFVPRVQTRLWERLVTFDRVVLGAEDALMRFDRVAFERARADLAPTLTAFDTRLAVAGFDEKRRRGVRRSLTRATEALASRDAPTWIRDRVADIEKARREVSLGLRRADGRTVLGTGGRALGLVALPSTAGIAILDVDPAAWEPLATLGAAVLISVGPRDESHGNGGA